MTSGRLGDLFLGLSWSHHRAIIGATYRPDERYFCTAMAVRPWWSVDWASPPEEKHDDITPPQPGWRVERLRAQRPTQRTYRRVTALQTGCRGRQDLDFPL